MTDPRQALLRLIGRFFEVPLVMLEEEPSGPLAEATLAAPGVLMVADVRGDPALEPDPRVERHGIRFFAARALRGPDGEPLGMLAICDREPRTMTEEYIADLDAFAGLAGRELTAAPGAAAGREPAVVEPTTQRMPAIEDPTAALLQVDSRLGGALEVTAGLEAGEDTGRLRRINEAMVNMLAHEFRTAVTGVQGFSELMLDHKYELNDMREFAADVNRDAHRLDQAIADMLELSRLGTGETAFEPRELGLNDVVTLAADRVRREAPEHHLAVELDPRLPEVLGDPERLFSAVISIIRNAAKYSPAGTTIEIRTQVAADGVEVAVRDHGAGIDAEAVARIFRWDSPAQRHGAGHLRRTGLPLPFVRQIAELHGGRAAAESVRGEGSVFHLVVPVATPPG